MSEFISTVRDVSRNYKVFDKWEQEQANKRAKQEHLSKTVSIDADRAEFNKKKVETVIRATEIMDKRSEDNAQNTEMATNAIAGLALMPVSLCPMALMAVAPKFMAKHSGKMPIVQGATTLVAGIGLILWGTKMTKEASRVGRFQAKNNELQDVKNFAVYSDEQIAQAKALAATMPDEDKKPNILKAFSEMKEMLQDKKEYKKWLQESAKAPQSDISNVNFTPEQLAQGEQDREILTNVVKDINIAAEEYSENVENTFDTLTVFSGLAAVPIGLGVSKILSALKIGAGGGAQKAVIAAASGLLATLGIAAWGASEQKKAARVGRFVQKQEILKDPNALLTYSEKEKQQAEHISAPVQKKGFFAKLGESFKFIKTYMQDKKAYKNYEKTERPENEKFQKALLQTELTKEQLDEAKHLQEKTFKTFDRVDEMSQRYSEDIEAGTEIAKQVVTTGFTLGSMAALATIPILLTKGKMPVHKLAKFISNLTLDKSSGIKQAVDKGFDVVKNDKNLKSHLSKALAFNSGSQSALLGNAKLKPALDSLSKEVSDLLPNMLSGKESLAEGLGKHFKKGPVAEWVRNLAVDVFKLVGKAKMPQDMLSSMPQVAQATKFNYKNYKTLINTAAIGAVPILGTLVGVPYAFNAWLTDIQKKAGKIGVMKAVDELDDAKLYVNQNANTVFQGSQVNQTQQQIHSSTETISQSLREYLMKHGK
ncbi:hypothetical protein tpqmel_0145 [Candidatus Gastranaerophilus sp. (ex Termes propinquus)]|nr:hypothetical protein tpqmel_0145 [Candidatus Gastranaerophilus sp. (ex Termes propinquus)]